MTVHTKDDIQAILTSFEHERGLVIAADWAVTGSCTISAYLAGRPLADVEIVRELMAMLGADQGASFYGAKGNMALLAFRIPVQVHPKKDSPQYRAAMTRMGSQPRMAAAVQTAPDAAPPEDEPAKPAPDEDDAEKMAKRFPFLQKRSFG